MALQYMTLISNGDRGVGHTTGNWQEGTSLSPPLSAGAQSNTSTPNAQRDPKKPSVKMSIADYKNLKTTGVKPPPRPSTSTPGSNQKSDVADHKPGHTRNISSASNDTPIGSVASLEGRPKPNGASAPVKPDQKAPSQEER